VRAAYTRSATGVGSGPSKARPCAVALKARTVANFIVEVCMRVRFSSANRV
jgi:hypothetical protein